MLKRILIIAGIPIVGISSFILLNKPLESDTAVANIEKQKPSFTKEEKLTHVYIELSVSEKLHEKYERDLLFRLFQRKH